MTINPYSIGPFISGSITLILGFYVFIKDYKNPIHQLFFVSLFPVSIWLLMYSVLYNANGNWPSVFHHYQLAYCAVSFIPICFFTFITTWLGLKWTKIWNILNYIYGFFICLIILKTPYILSGTYICFFGPYPKAGSLHPFFLVYFIFLISLEIILLIIYLIKTSDKYKKSQIKFFLSGYVLITFACADFAPNYGIEIYPPGFLFFLSFALILAYAIFRHNLLEIKTFISNSIIYSVLNAFVFLLYSVTVLIIERFLQGYLGYTSLSLSIICAFTIGLIVIPLRNLIQNYIDNAFLKGTPYQISEENALLRQELTNADKLRSIAILASSLAHEIKNPITTINTFADFLPSKQNDTAFLNKCRQTLLHETNRIQQLLTELLSFAKPSPPVFQAIHPQEIIEEILLLLEHKCAKQNVKITKSYTSDEFILADSNQLKQVFLNIFLNAAESMPKKGILTIETRCDNKTYVITIKDTGVGIKPEELKKIFDPFFTNKENSVGLGLAISREIIHHHNGKINVKSTPNIGTEFIISLPRHIKGADHES